MSPIFWRLSTVVGGRTYGALSDQIIWVPASDVAALLAAGWSDVSHVDAVDLGKPPRRA